MLVETDAGIPLDISLAGLPYEGRMIQRSSPWDVAAELRPLRQLKEDREGEGRLQALFDKHSV